MERSNTLRYGDLITLKYLKLSSHLSGEGILVEDLVVSDKITDFENHLFQVCVQLQYSAANEYEEFIENLNGDVTQAKDAATRKHLDALVRGKSNEVKMNENFMIMRTGSDVLFGDFVQLRHYKSGKYITVRPGELARDERENLSIHLNTQGSMNSWLQILPRYKIDREGDKISSNTEMLLRIAERQQEHLHCSEREPPRGKQREVNSSLESATPWRMSIFQSSLDSSSRGNLLMGNLVYIRDPETNSVLVPFFSKKEEFPVDIAPDDMSVSVVSGESMLSGSDMRSGSRMKKSSESEASESEEEDDVSITSAEEFEQEYGNIILKPMDEDYFDSNAVWIVESKSIVRGGPLMWKTEQIRLRHLNTGKYLCINSEDASQDKHTFSLTENSSDKKALFMFSELHSTSDILRNSKAIQMKHGSIYIERGDKNDRHRCYTVLGSRHRMKAVSLIINRYTESSGDDDHSGDKDDAESSGGNRVIMDVYVAAAAKFYLKHYLSITVVPSPRNSVVNTIWPQVLPADRHLFTLFIEKFVRFIQGYPLAIDPNWMSTYKVNPKIRSRRQHLFREQGIMDVIIKILDLLRPISERSITGEAHLNQLAEGGLISMAKAVITDCLKILFELVKECPSNQIYVADEMSILLAHVSSDRVAALIAREMLNNNRELQETKIGNDEIVTFAERMRESEMNAMFLQLLQSCCSCQGHGIPRNQITVNQVVYDQFQDILISFKAHIVDRGSPEAVAADWSSLSSYDLYMPPLRSKHHAPMMGSSLLESGLLSLTVAWSSTSKDFMPVPLFGKPAVNILDIYKLNSPARMSISGASTRDMLSSAMGRTSLLPTSSMVSTTSSSSIITTSKKSAVEIAARKKAIGDFFTAQLYLSAEMCFERNYSVILTMEKMYSFESLVSLLRLQVPEYLKGAAIKLIMHLYVDRDPQHELNVPRLSRTLTDLLNSQATSIITVEESEIYKFAILQVIIADHIRQVKGRPLGFQTLHMMQLLRKLVSFNYYGTIEKLNDIIEHIVAALNRVGIEYATGDASAAALSHRANFNRQASVRRRKNVNLTDVEGDLEMAEKKGKGGGATSTTTITEDIEPADEPSVNMDEIERTQISKIIIEYLESLRHLCLMLGLVFVAIAVTIWAYITNNSSKGLEAFEYLILAIFAFEVALRGVTHMLSRWNLATFLCDPFNIIDLTVVLLDILVIASSDTLGKKGKFLKALRLLRLARLLRAVRVINKVVNNMKIIPAPEWSEPLRYSKTDNVCLDTMEVMVEVLRCVQRRIEDRNLSIFLIGLEDLRNRNAQVDSSKFMSLLDQVSEKSQDLKVGSDEYDSIYIDLLMYSRPALVQKTLEILMNHHSTKQQLLTNLSNLQLLSSNKRENQFKRIEIVMTHLKRYADTHATWGKLHNDDHLRISKEMHSYLEEVTEACRKRRSVLCFDEVYEPDKQTQDLLRNLGCIDLCISIARLMFTIDADEHVTSSTKNTKSLVLLSNTLMYWVILLNDRNQAIAYKHLPFFIDTIDKRIDSHRVIQAIFSGNENLMKACPKQYIHDFVSLICNSGQFPQYLSLLGSVVSTGTSNVIENQYEVIRAFSSPGNQKKILKWFVPVTHPDYNKKLQSMSKFLNKKDVTLDDLPSDLAYHLDLMNVLSLCTVGQAGMTTIEAKVQSMYSFVDLINAMLDPACLLLARIKYGLFLFNSMIEVEMRLQSLKDADCIWKLIESMQDIFLFSKDEIRQIEKNGWAAPTSNRQKVEYMIVCAQICFGYFHYYFDTTIFRPDVAATLGVPRVMMKESRANEIMRQLYTGLRSIYEMRSPLLSNEHMDIMLAALKALNKAATVPIVSFVEDIHSPAKDMVEGGGDGGNNGEKKEEAGESKEGDNAGKGNDSSDKKMVEEKEYFKDVPLTKLVQMFTEDEEVIKTADDEFQSFISRINDVPARLENLMEVDVRFEPLLTRLINHIRSSIRIVVHGTEYTKFMDDNATKTSIWIIKIFRTMIENKWGMSIYERDDDGGEEQDIAAAKIMSTLNNCRATEMCLDLVARGIEIPLQAEAIKLLVALLFKEGGAKDVQVSIYKHLSRPGSDLFFFHIRYLIQNLITWHQVKGVVILPEGEDPDLPEEIILIRCLQLMCEGHYQPNQDIMREQPNNQSQVNLLDDFVAYIQVLDTVRCRTSTHAALAVSATILEVIQGPCVGNQDYFALNTELIETLNKKLRYRSVNDCDEGEETELKKTAIDIFQGLLEGQGKKTAIYERMLSVIHLDVLQILGEVPESGEEDEDAAVLRTESLVLMQMLCDFRPSLREEMKLKDLSSVGSIGCVEVIWRGELQRRFFNVPDICQDLAQSTKDHFILNVNRSSPEAKLLGLLDGAREMYREIVHQQLLKEWGLAVIFSRTNQYWATWAAFTFALVINLLFEIFYYAVPLPECPIVQRCPDEPCFLPSMVPTSMPSSVPSAGPTPSPTPALPLTIPPTATLILEDVFNSTTNSTSIPICTSVRIDPAIPPVILGFNILNLLCAAFVLITVMVVRMPVNFQTNSAKGLSQFAAVLYTALDYSTMYSIIYTIFSILGLFYYDFLPFLLLDLIFLVPTLKGVLDAVFLPWKQFLATIVLAWIITYIFCMIYFINYNMVYEEFGGTQIFNINVPQNAESMVKMLKWWIRYGSETGSLNTYGDLSMTVTSNRFVLEFIYFIAMFVMWNIIKGITINQFVEIRNKKLARDQDMNQVCFICGIEDIVFSRALDREAFSRHTSIDHNIWNYIYWIIYIWQQDKDDDDGLEYYVRHLIDDEDLSWFPMNKAIVLQEHHEKSMNSSLSSVFQQQLTGLEEKIESNLRNFKEQMARTTLRIEQTLAHVDESASQVSKQQNKSKAEGDDGSVKNGASPNNNINAVGSPIQGRRPTFVGNGLVDDSNTLSGSISLVFLEVNGVPSLPFNVCESMKVRVLSDFSDELVAPLPLADTTKLQLGGVSPQRLSLLVQGRDDLGKKHSLYNAAAGTSVLQFDHADQVVVHRGKIPKKSALTVRLQLTYNPIKSIGSLSSLPPNLSANIPPAILGTVDVPLNSILTCAKAGGGKGRMYVEVVLMSKTEPEVRREDSLVASVASLTSAGGSRAATAAGRESRDGRRGRTPTASEGGGSVEEKKKEEVEVFPCIISIDVVATEDYLNAPGTAEGGMDGGKDGGKGGDGSPAGEGVAVILSRGKPGQAQPWEFGEDGGGSAGGAQINILDFNSSIESLDKQGEGGGVEGEAEEE